ncbi:MAG: colicin import membrane protein [Halopseudomonas sp.]|uniref:cell envelope integrity protein TolA n=1 Tax=Halopseudomonas sp. TaxID=2901191 RepID=UPI0039E5F79D
MNTREPREAEAGSYAPSVLKALAVHLAVVLLLFVSFSSAPVFEPAKPIVQATLVQLNSKSPAQTQTDQRIAGEAARTAAQRHEAEELKRDQQKQKQQEAAAAAAKASEQAAAKREEQQREQQQKEAAAATSEQKAAAAKQVEAAKQAEAEAQRKADAARKLAAAEDAKKAAAEAAKKKAAEEAAKQKAAEQAKNKSAEEAKRKAEAARADEARKKAEAEKVAQQKSAQEEARAKALADLLADETQYQQAQADLSGDEVAASYDDLIRRYVSEQWRRPPTARNGMVVDVVISMLPTGQITDVVIVRTSGDPGFDQSAVQAVRNVGRIPEMQQLSREKPATFDSLYRKRTLRFKPEDLSF